MAATTPHAIALLVVSGPTAPGQPTGLTPGTVTTASVPLTWTAPASDGGSAITDYLVEYSLDGSSWTTFAHSPSTTPSITVTSLLHGRLYYFRVSAVNAVGAGSPSTTATATTLLLGTERVRLTEGRSRRGLESGTARATEDHP